MKIKKSEVERLTAKLGLADSESDDEMPVICGEEDLRYYL